MVDLTGGLISYECFFYGFLFLPGESDGGDLFLCGNQVLNVRSFVAIHV